LSSEKRAEWNAELPQTSSRTLSLIANEELKSDLVCSRVPECLAVASLGTILKTLQKSGWLFERATLIELLQKLGKRLAHRRAGEVALGSGLGSAGAQTCVHVKFELKPQVGLSLWQAQSR
jgi:hypothetical protein